MARYDTMLELLLLVATVAGYRIAHTHGVVAPFIGGAILFWAGYVIGTWRRHPDVAAAWGFRSGGLLPSSAACGGLVLAGLGVLAAVAAFHGAAPPPWHFWIVVGIYPLWGLLQQFLLNGLVARRLERHMKAPAVVLVTALLFGLAHLPQWRIGLLAFAVAVPTVMIWLRWRNLWPLGVCHGILGAVAYYLVLQQNVWPELLASAGAG